MPIRCRVHVWTQAARGSGSHEYVKEMDLVIQPYPGVPLDVRVSDYLIGCHVDSTPITEGLDTLQVCCQVSRSSRMDYEQIDRLFANDPHWQKVETLLAVPA